MADEKKHKTTTTQKSTTTVIKNEGTKPVSVRVGPHDELKPAHRYSILHYLIGGLLFLLVVFGQYLIPPLSSWVPPVAHNDPTQPQQPRYSNNKQPLCPIPAKIYLQNTLTSRYILADPDFRTFSASRLSKAIRIDTSVAEDEEDFKKLNHFHVFLRKEFREVFKAATNVFRIHQYGLILEFIGSNKSLKPILLTVHQDTPPFGNIGEWSKEPLSGMYDGQSIYGRGSSKSKNLLIGYLEAMDMLLKQGFRNQRTIILSFGFDESAVGIEGSAYNAQFLIDRYGESSMDHIIDEGPPVLSNTYGPPIGVITIAEKGSVDIRVEITTPPGDTSLPDDHTSIGILSQFLTEYEYDQFKPTMPIYSPYLCTMQCLAEHTNMLSKALRDDVLKSHYDVKANNRVMKHAVSDKNTKYLIQTAQSINLIIGGESPDLLPRNASAIINHRIALGNDLNTVWDKMIYHGKAIADEHNLGLVIDNGLYRNISADGNIFITAHNPVNIAPIAPTYDPTWQTLTSRMRAFYEDVVYPEYFKENSLVITPGLTTKHNTDTKYYWKLSSHIYKFQPGENIDSRKDGVDEHIRVDSHLQVVAFYYHYLQEVCGY